MSNDPLNVNTNDPKIVSIVSYLTLIGWVIAFLLNNPKSEQASFHIRQALGIYLLLIVSGFCFIVPFIGWLAGIVGYILGAVLWVLGLISAVQQEEKEVPVLGDRFQEWFQAV